MRQPYRLKPDSAPWNVSAAIPSLLNGQIKKPPFRAACEEVTNPMGYLRRRNKSKPAAPKPANAIVEGSGAGVTKLKLVQPP